MGLEAAIAAAKASAQEAGEITADGSFVASKEAAGEVIDLLSGDEGAVAGGDARAGDVLVLDEDETTAESTPPPAPLETVKPPAAPSLS